LRLSQQRKMLGFEGGPLYNPSFSVGKSGCEFAVEEITL